jgi:hypothetical protein
MYSKACSLLWSTVKLGLLFVIVAAPAGGGGSGGGASAVPALQYTINDRGTTTTPNCDFSLGYICRFAAAAGATVTVANTPGTPTAPVHVEIHAYINNANAAITFPATFFAPQGGNPNVSPVMLATQRAGGGSANSVFVWSCDGTNCYYQDASMEKDTWNINVAGTGLFSGATNTFSNGSASALKLTAGSVLSSTGGTAPTLTAGCNGAGSSVNASSTDNRGQFTTQTANATTCTLTFNHTWPQAPFCLVVDANANIVPIGVSVGAESTTTLVIDFASQANKVFNYMCM